MISLSPCHFQHGTIPHNVSLGTQYISGLLDISVTLDSAQLMWLPNCGQSKLGLPTNYLNQPRCFA